MRDFHRLRHIEDALNTPPSPVRTGAGWRVLGAARIIPSRLSQLARALDGHEA